MPREVHGAQTPLSLADEEAQNGTAATSTHLADAAGNRGWTSRVVWLVRRLFFARWTRTRVAPVSSKLELVTRADQRNLRALLQKTAHNESYG